jgi:hypothetical protein
MISSHPRSGFAIGTILLAVVLIAALVSALAIASRGSSNTSGREKARIAAATTINTAYTLKQNIERLLAQGIDANSLFMAEISGNPTHLPYAGNYCRNDTSTRTCALVDFTPQPIDPLFLEPQLAAPFYSERWEIYRIIGATHQASIIAWIGLTKSFCQQINNILMGESPSTEPAGVAHLIYQLQTGSESSSLDPGDEANLHFTPGEGGCLQKNPPGPTVLGANSYTFYYVVAP